MVLLVGGDTFDYLNYLGTESKSFIPTFYAQTDDIVKFSPADPVFADLNGDTVPEVALGRFPVTNAAELEGLINKTLEYETKDYNGTAIFSADLFFGSYTDNFVNAMPPGWSNQKIYLDQLSVSEARSTLLDRMNTGIALANYFGHSTTTEWSSSSFFTASDAVALTNSQKPMVVVQYGCWNSYFVEPSQNTLVQKFLLTGDRGAAAVMGSTTLNYVHSQIAFGKLLTPRLTVPGTTIGEAFMLAKQDLAVRWLNYTEIFLGWSLLGDPALVVQP
jgi:hypothetical protein